MYHVRRIFQESKTPQERSSEMYGSFSRIKGGRNKEDQIVFRNFMDKMQAAISQIQYYRLKKYNSFIWDEVILFDVAHRYFAEKLADHEGLFEGIKHFVTEIRPLFRSPPAPGAAPTHWCSLNEMLLHESREVFSTSEGIIRLIDTMISADFYRMILKNDPIAWVLWTHILASLHVLSDRLPEREKIKLSEKAYGELLPTNMIQKINNNIGARELDEIGQIRSLNESLDHFFTEDQVFINVSLATKENIEPALRALYRHLLAIYLSPSVRIGSDPHPIQYRELLTQIMTKLAPGGRGDPQKNMIFLNFVEAIEESSRDFFQDLFFPRQAAYRRAQADKATPSLVYESLEDANTPTTKLVSFLYQRVDSVNEKIAEMARNPELLLGRKRILSQPENRPKQICSAARAPDTLEKCKFFIHWNYVLLYNYEVQLQTPIPELAGDFYAPSMLKICVEIITEYYQIPLSVRAPKAAAAASGAPPSGRVPTPPPVHHYESVDPAAPAEYATVSVLPHYAAPSGGAAPVYQNPGFAAAAAPASPPPTYAVPNPDGGYGGGPGTFYPVPLGHLGAGPVYQNPEDRW